MSTHPTEQEFARYHWRAMSPAELLALDDHLAVCEECRRRLGEMERTRSVYDSLREDLRSVAAESSAQGFLRRLGGRAPLRWAAASLTLLALAAAFLVLKARWSPPVSNVEAGRPTPASESSPTSNAGQNGGPAVYNAGSSETLPPAGNAPDAQAAPQDDELALDDGGARVTLDAEGNLRGMEGLPADLQRAVRTALRTQRAQVSPALDSLGGRRETLLGESEARPTFSLLSPVGVILNTTRPLFRWRSLEGADGYVVSVYDADFRLTASSPRLTGTEWKADAALARGVTYSWQVSAFKDGKEVIAPAAPLPQAKFRVLEEAASSRLEDARRAYGNSHLLLGVLYAREGLLAEAEREFQSLLRANPRSKAASNLLRSVRARRG